VPITLAVAGVAPRYFATWRALKWALSLMYKFFGGLHSRNFLQKFGRAKKSKIRPDFEQLSSLTAYILKTGWDIKNWKQTWSTMISAGCRKNFCELWFTNNKVAVVDVDLPQVDIGLSAYANAFEFGPRDFATRGISLSWNFPNRT